MTFSKFSWIQIIFCSSYCLQNLFLNYLVTGKKKWCVDRSTKLRKHDVLPVFDIHHICNTCNSGIICICDNYEKNFTKYFNIIVRHLNV